MTSPTTGLVPPAAGATPAPTAPPDPSSASTGEPVGTLTDRISSLVRDEVRLAQAEPPRKAGRLGIGAGLLVLGKEGISR